MEEEEVYKEEEERDFCVGKEGAGKEREEWSREFFLVERERSLLLTRRRERTMLRMCASVRSG